MKIIAIVGSESHTSSYASARLETPIKDPKDGKTYWQQTPQAWKRGMKKDEDRSRLNANWWLLELEVPEGAILRYTVKGGRGAHGADKSGSVLEFRVSESAEVIEAAPDAALVDGFIKGRMIRLQSPPKKQIDTEHGF